MKKLLKKIGLKKNDTIYLASNILPLMIQYNNNNKKIIPHQIINDILDIIGKNGTLLLPTFNWDYCVKKKFDIKKTISKCGALSNIALNREDFSRTKHPIYSFAVTGKYKNFLCSLNNKSAWGPNSPFDFMYNKKAKNLFIGIDYKDAFTMDHYFEQKAKVKYRYSKDFTSIYINKFGKKSKKKYSMFVRDKKNCKFTKLDESLDKILEEKKYLKKIIFKKNIFSFLDIYKTGKIIIKDLKTKKHKYIYPVV